MEAEERRLAREREEIERQRRWEVAMNEAKRRLIEDHRRQVLRARVDAWREATEIRAYCDAVEARHGVDVVAADPAAREWLALARTEAERIQELPRMPAEPEATPEALKPFLGPWSPHGPRGW